MYAPNIRATKYIKQILTELKGEIDSNIIIMGACFYIWVQGSSVFLWTDYKREGRNDSLFGHLYLGDRGMRQGYTVTVRRDSCSWQPGMGTLGHFCGLAWCCCFCLCSDVIMKGSSFPALKWLEIHKNCKTSTERSHAPITQLPPIIHLR